MLVAVEVPSNPAPDWTHDAVFASERQSAERARSFVSSHLVDHRLLRLVNPVRAVTSELSANAIVHAGTPFAVTLSRTGPVVLLVVQDTAPDSPAALRPVQVMAERGYGLNLVATLSRAWGVTTTANNSKCVWASFDIRPHGERGWS
jgi:anti-sigma regulatory factor (Ser/Thr protein kinase)